MWAVRHRQMKGKSYILSTHCTAIQMGQASESVSKIACLLNSISSAQLDSDSNQSQCDMVAIKDKEHCEEVLPEQHL